MGERIRWLLDQFPNRVEAAEIAGVTPEHLASYIAGRAKPPFELVARLAAAKNVSLDWLASGEGSRQAGEAEPDGFVSIPVARDADAGPDGGEDAVLFSAGFLHGLGAADIDKLRIVVQRGAANEPVIRDGDLLLVDTSNDRIARDGLYVSLRDGRYFVRFVETAPNGTVTLKSRNPEYGTQTLAPEEAEQLRIFGRVRWRSGAV
ncbi:MAG: S24 family peptidase [Rhizomicrobium sp.]